jgi:Flp pilus assembly protein TadD
MPRGLWNCQEKKSEKPGESGAGSREPGVGKKRKKQKTTIFKLRRLPPSVSLNEERCIMSNKPKSGSWHVPSRKGEANTPKLIYPRKTQQGEAALLFIEGMNLGRDGAHDRALVCFDQVITLEPDHLRARYNRGVCLLELGRLAESAQVFRELLSICPADADVYNNIAKIMLRAGRHKQAALLFEKTLQIDPNHADALCRLGLIAGKIHGDIERAMRLFHQALDINENIPEAHQGLGICYHHTGNYQRAIEHLNKARHLDASNPSIYNLLGIVFLKLGDETQAETFFKQALRLNPNTRLSHENLWAMMDQ